MKTGTIYKWPDKRGYLINDLAPDAVYLPAKPGETSDSVLERLEGTCESFWFHLDCSKTLGFPASRTDLLAALAERRIHVVNGHVTDISKRYLQQFNREHGFVDVSAEETGDPDELVIVKSNYNALAGPERKLSAWEQDYLGVSATAPEGFSYYVAARSSIDPSVWRNPALTCERFIGNELGIYYRAFICRPKIATVQLRCPAPIKKARTSTRMQIMWHTTGDASAASSVIPGLVCRFIDAFLLDFGAIDIVTDLKGVAAVIDVNSTPWATPHPGVNEYLAG